jgi:hypothetical protein
VQDFANLYQEVTVMNRIHKTVADMIRHHLNPLKVRAKLRRILSRTHAKSVALVYEKLFTILL